MIGNVLSAAGAALLLAAAAAAQNAWPVQPEQRLHVKVVRAERTARFFQTWTEADDAHRTRATAFLESERSSGAPEGRRPTLETIAMATRVLRGADPDEVRADELQRFVDSLDLQTSPGAFDHHTEGRGEPITVRFYRLTESVFRKDVTLGLRWIGTDGTELPARTEPIGARHFDTPGGLMYVRSPLSEEGAWWRLVPTVERDGHRAEGVGIHVQCCSDRRRRELREDGGANGRETSDLLDKGMRAAGPVLGGHPLLGAFPTLHAELPPAVHLVDPEALEAHERALSDLRLRWVAGGERTGSPPAERGRLVLLFIAPVGECAESLFFGPVGDAWAEFARERDAVLCSVELEPKQGAALVELIERWKGDVTAEPADEVIVVARGDAVALLHPALSGREVPVDGYVLCTERSGPGRALPPAPTLLITGAPLADGQRADLTVSLDPSPVFLRELTLPERIASWLETRKGH